MNAMKNKIKSQKGASITFALLLFLVCAIISSIVVVAATAVGGRASQMAELDQRYYAVNSAAELLRDVLEDQTVVVTASTTTVSKLDQDGNITPGQPSDKSYTMVLKSNPTDIDISSAEDNLVSDAAKVLVGQKTDTKLATLSLSASLAETEQASLTVTITPTIDKNNRRLYISVSNTDVTNGAYTLVLTFKADIVENNNEYKTYSAPTPVSGGGYTRDETKESTTVSTISWKLIDLRTAYATAA